jgi:diaminohydroxyphosphoribosylaminopyrimidine deaminase/5-amino-6-(5-phosphoribosylamino)uracil reductase
MCVQEKRAASSLVQHQTMTSDEIFMKKAIMLAQRGLGRTSPNPVVGAVVVKGHQIVGSGYHRKAGARHAEIEALAQAGEGARDATIYVNLEPCNHYGRTPPCTNAIAKSGIRRVVIGITDPNLHVTGGGSEYLRSKGIQVSCGVLQEECSRLNEAYLTYVTTGRPFVILKVALTLDGWIATRTGDSKWITSERSRKQVHILRRTVDAVMVGVETVMADNPRLMPYLLRSPSPNPVKVIADTHLRTPLDSMVLDSKASGLTIIAAGSKVNRQKKRAVQERGAKIIPCRLKNGRIDLSDLLKKLAAMEISSILVEGGATLFDSFVRDGLVDKFYMFFGPRIIGGDNGVPFTRGPGCDIIAKCMTVRVQKVKRLGDDLMIEAYPQR